LIPARIVREWLPKFTVNFISFSERATSSTRSMVPIRRSSASSAAASTLAFVGAGLNSAMLHLV
jgi:hypothetical protein